MRHKTFLINPSILLNKKIKIHKVLQKPGEFIITLGKCYHAGFNMGYNCAEAVNFANRNWIRFGFKAKSCNCRKDSVKINMRNFMKNLLMKKKLTIKEKKFLIGNNVLEKKDLEEFGKKISKTKINCKGKNDFLKKKRNRK